MKPAAHAPQHTQPLSRFNGALVMGWGQLIIGLAHELAWPIVTLLLVGGLGWKFESNIRAILEGTGALKEIQAGPFRLSLETISQEAPKLIEATKKNDTEQALASAEKIEVANAAIIETVSHIISSFPRQASTHTPPRCFEPPKPGS
jgi:hypothetical protein